METLPRLSIRFQISLVLLLSALNGIVLFTFAAKLMADDTGTDSSAWASVGQRVALLEEEVLTGDAEAAAASFDELQLTLSELPADSLRPAVRAWRGHAERYLSEGGEDELEALRESYLRVLGAVQVDLAPREPDTADLRMVFTWMMVWVVVSTAMLLVMSFRLRGVLSEPLETLGAAAERVASGKLAHPMPKVAHSREIEGLRDSLESMRLSLASTIEQVDHQNSVMTSMLGALNDGVLLVDPDGRVLNHNPAAAQFFRYLAGRDLRAGSRATQAVPSEQFTNAATVTEKDVVDGTGSVRHFSLRVEPLERRSVDSAHLVVIRDITKDVQIEDLKREFLSVVTHELKTPLTAIQGFVKLLLMGKGGELSAKQHDLLSRTQEQSEALKRMVQDLLDSSRLEGGNLLFDWSLVEAARAAEDATTSFRGTALSKGLRLASQVDLPPDVLVRVDDMRLQQILGNLLKNAIKFTDRGGSVTLRADLPSPDQVRFQVVDTGRGVPTDALEHLFKRFYQVERGDTRRSGGAGLGLYICRQLSTAMGGEISVQSRVGEGSTFTLTLPRAKMRPDTETP